MKLHLPSPLRKAVLRAVCAVSAVASSLSGSYAAMITPDGRTATSVINQNSVFDVYTGTVRGNIGFNSFSTFDVYSGTTVNLHLPDHTGKLINVVRDKTTNIDGVLNSYKDGRIGGEVYLLNPNGIMVGKNGVINVGSITMSTPTALFVEELIRRDGSISDTAAQAVLAGDMPINAKGVISVKGKVNAKDRISIHAGRAEVTGELHTGVKFEDMVNTKGTAHMDGKGMSVKNGKISFGKKPRPAKSAKQPRRAAGQKRADIAVFADDVFLDGAELDAPSVYIDPDKAELHDMAVSGNFVLEARVIVLSGLRNDPEKALTSFTLNAANELSDGTFDGHVSITLSDSDLIADSLSIAASATSAGADAVIVINNSCLTTTGNSRVSAMAGLGAGNAALTVSGSTLTALLTETERNERVGETPQSLLHLSAVAESGSASVQADAASSLDGAGTVELTAMAGQGAAAVRAESGSVIQGNTVSLTALAPEGDATVTANGTLKGRERVELVAETGWQESNGAEEPEEWAFSARGSGSATVEVNGSVSTEGSLTLSAASAGTEGAADVLVGEQAELTANGTVHGPVGQLELPRTEAETLTENDSEETALAKNKAYMDRYAAYLQSLPQATVSESLIQLSAFSQSGRAAVKLAAGSDLQAGLAVYVDATAATEAAVLAAGHVAAGDIAAAAKGTTARITLPETGVMKAGAHGVLENISAAEGSGCALVEKTGSIELSAQFDPAPGTPQEPVPTKKDGVILEVAGSLISRRERESEGAGGTLSLNSDGTLEVKNTAVLDASSAAGEGGVINLSAPEYALADPQNYSVAGSAGSGSVVVLSCTNLTAENLNNAETLSDDFLKELTQTAAAPDSWHVQFSSASLSGTVSLDKDWDVALNKLNIADGTHIIGNGHSMTFSGNFGETLCSPKPAYTVGDNVTIEDVQNFTVKFGQVSLSNMAFGLPLTLPTTVTFGENFTLAAEGNVTISIKAYSGTAVTFKPGANITAGGKVSIAAETLNGWGFNLYEKNSAMDLNAVLAMFSTPGEKPWVDAIGTAGVVKLYPGRIFKGFINWMRGKPKDPKESDKPQFGFRISNTDIVFEDAPGKAASVTGSGISISATSKASSGGRTEAANSYAGISLFFNYNKANVNLGSQLTLTSTGSEEDETGDIEVSCSTETTSSPALLYGSEKVDGTALAFMLNVIRDSSTLTIGEGTTLHASENISVSNESEVEQCPFTSSGVSDKSIADLAIPTNMLSFGANVLISDTKTVVDGTLTADNGDITVKNSVDINSTLTMGTTFSFVVEEAGDPDEPDEKKYPESFSDFLTEIWREGFQLNFGNLAKYKFDEDDEKWEFKSTIDKKNIENVLASGEDLAKKVQAVLGDRDKPEAKERVTALSLAATVVEENNQLLFNGTATAENGSVELNAESSLEVAAGAETSVLGVPARSVYAISLAAPVVDSHVSVELGSKAKVTAGDDVSISSSTELPMSFDVLEWRNWKNIGTKFAKNWDLDVDEIVGAVKKSASFVADYYDSGNFGVLDTLTSSHAYTVVEKTGVEGGEDSRSIGGSLTADYRNISTLTLIADGAELSAGGAVSVSSSAEGLHIAAAGQIPFYLTMGSRLYVSTTKASSGYGASFVLGHEGMDTVTYVGAANVTAGTLNVSSEADVFALDLSAAGTFGAAKDGVQGALNVITEDKMTVAEISNGATITLTQTGEKAESGVSAEDKSALWNISGMEGDGGRLAVGVGVAVTLSDSYTAALLGNAKELPNALKKRWDKLAKDRLMPFAGSGTLSLNLPTKGAVTFSVEALQHGSAVTLGIAAAVQTNSADATALAAGAANVGVAMLNAGVEARQSGVRCETENEAAEVETHAENDMTIVSVAGDVSVNKTDKNTVTGAGSVSVNAAAMETLAEVLDSEYEQVGDFAVKAENNAALVSLDLASAVGAATVDIAAGTAWNSATGTTQALLSGGSVSADEVTVFGKTDLLSTTITLGAAVSIDLSSLNGADNRALREAGDNLLQNSQAQVDAGLLELGGGGMREEDDLLSVGGIGEEDSLMALANDGPQNMLRAGGVSFAVGASIARNALSMNTEAVLEGCEVTADDSLSVTAEDRSVITALSVGAAVQRPGEGGELLSVAAGGVFSFAPVSSTTHASVRQSDGESGLLDITAGSLTLTATDNHRERLWSFGGGFGDSLGLGVVVAWGSYAGAATLVDADSVNLTIGSKGADASETNGKVTILADSSLENTFVALGGSAASTAALSGTVNYQNFNNRVETNLKNSTLNVEAEQGAVSIGSESTRNFTDILGAVSLGIITPSAGQPSAGSGAFGAALSFIYLGGNGEKDYCTTYTTVDNSILNNAGKTAVYADTAVTGLLAEVSCAAAAGENAAFTLNGAFSWVTDESDTQTRVGNTTFNKRNTAADAAAEIEVTAKSNKHLTTGVGSLGVAIGPSASGAVGVSVHFMKDKAVTAAAMQDSGVALAHDFLLSADSEAHLNGLLIGGTGSGNFAASGAAFVADIQHDVDALADSAYFNLNGGFEVKAENQSRIGDGNTRFTIANAGAGVMGVGVGAAISLIDVKDDVNATANNVAVTTATADITAKEDAYSDAVTVNFAGGLYGGGTVDVSNPCLHGQAVAALTSDLGAMTMDGKVRTIGISASGNLNVLADNTQYMRSHVWTFDAGIMGGAVLVNVNRMNLAGCSNAYIEGNMALTIGGDMNVLADTQRTGAYTTVTVAGGLYSTGVYDENSFRVSEKTDIVAKEYEEETQDAMALATAKLDEVAAQASGMLSRAAVQPTGSDDALGAGPAAELHLYELREGVPSTQPLTIAKVDLKGQTADVSGSATVKATETLTTTPTVVGVNGALATGGLHITATVLNSDVRAEVVGGELKAGKDIYVGSSFKAEDRYDAVAVPIGAVSLSGSLYEWNNTSAVKTLVSSATLDAAADVTVTADSDVQEKFNQVDVAVAIGSVMVPLPSFVHNGTADVTLADAATLKAGGTVDTLAKGALSLTTNLVDVSVTGLNVDVLKPQFTLNSTQKVTVGENVKLTAKHVNVRQQLNHRVSAALRHYGLGVVELTFPNLNVTETADTGIGIGSGAVLTAVSGGTITIDSQAAFDRTTNLNGGTLSALSVASRGNSGSVTANNKVVLGDNVTLKADDGTTRGNIQVRAKTEDRATFRTDNLYINAVGGEYSESVLRSTLTDTLTIGTGFKAVADSVSLQAESMNDLTLFSNKDTGSILLEPYGKVRGETHSVLTSAVSVAGGEIDTESFEAKALTESTTKPSAMATGMSILFDNNMAELVSDSAQNARVVLGTDNNKLTILTDNTDIAANNKTRYGSPDTNANVWGGGVSVAAERTSGKVEVRPTVRAEVTLGSGTEINRRKDVPHYLNRDAYHTSVAATNDVENYVSLDIFAGAVLPAVCQGTTTAETEAYATLNLLGSVDCWGDAALTAYSHVRQHEQNEPHAKPYVFSSSSYITNTVEVQDTLNLSGTLSVAGDLDLNVGSAAAELTLADGTVVLPGEFDVVTRDADCGADSANQHNRRTDTLNLSGTVLAGGNVSVSNNPAANTLRQVFSKTGNNSKDKAAAYQGAPEVTSALNITGSLTAGLGSYLKVNVYADTANEVQLDFATAFDYFGIGTADHNTYVAHRESLQGLYEQRDGVFCLSPLAIEGSAVTIVTADNNIGAASLAGKVFTVSTHGMEIQAAASLPCDVVTTGAAVRSSAEGISLNGSMLAKPDTLTLPELRRAGAVSLLNEAKQGKATLTLQGLYSMPGSTLYVHSRGNLNAVGTFRCGSTEFYTEGDYSMQPKGDYYMESLARMFGPVFEKYRDAETAARAESLKGINDGKEDYSYALNTVTKNLSAAELQAAQQAPTGEIVTAGSVTIKAEGVVDLNGTVTAGALFSDGEHLAGDRSVTIQESFMLKDAAGNRITVEEARLRHAAGGTSSLFAVADIAGIAAHFDVETDTLIVSCDNSAAADIYIEGNIVNTDLTGKASLNMAPDLGDLVIENRSAYTLRLDTLDLSGFCDNRMVLKNTHTGVTDIYYRAENGKICHTVQRGNGGAEEAAYDGLLHLNTDMKGHLSRTLTTVVHESGRLTFGGELDGDPVNRTAAEYGGLFGEKKTMVDKTWLDTATASSGDYSVSYDAAGNVNTFTTARSKSAMTCTKLNNPGSLYRYVYELEFKEYRTDTLTLSGNNDIRLNIGGTESGTSVRVTSGDILVNGSVTADRVALTATEQSVSATATGLVTAAGITLEAKGDIGSEGCPLRVDSREVNLAGMPVTSSFSAGKSLYIEAVGNLADTAFRAGGTAMLQAEGSVSTDARYGSSAKRTYVRSVHGSVSLQDGTAAAFTPGELSVTAQDDVTINTKNALSLVSAVSEQKDVTITAKGGITPVLQPDTDSFDALFGETVSTSLYQQSLAMSQSYREMYFRDMERYTALYYRKDAAGNYTNRDADGLLRLDSAEADLAAMTDALTLAYENGLGNSLADSLFRYSGSEVVQGTKFANAAEAGVYLAMHPQEVLTAYAKACHTAVMADLTQEIRRNSAEEETAADYGMFNESVYRLYWQKDALGNYMWQDAEGNFISPTYTDASGHEAAVYTESTCAAVTEQFRGTAPAPSYRLKGNNTMLTTLGQLAGGYTALTDALTRMKEDVGSIAIGKAVQTTPTISARHGEVKLDTGSADIGSASFVFTITPRSYEEDGSPVYGSWEQSFIKEVLNAERMGTRLVGEPDESGTYTFAIDYFHTMPNTMSALDLALLSQASADDIRELVGTYEVRPHGYLGVDSARLSLKGGSVYISSESDIYIGEDGISGTDVRLSAAGSVSGGALAAEERAVVHAGVSVGSSLNPLSIYGTPRLSVTAATDGKRQDSGKVYLTNTGDFNLLNLRAETATLWVKGGSTIRKAAPQKGSLAYKAKSPVVEVGRLNTICVSVGDVSNLFAPDLAIRTTGITEEKGGLHLSVVSVAPHVANLTVNAANTAYPFYMALENGGPVLKNFTLNFSGYAELSPRIKTVNGAQFVLNNPAVGINALKTYAGTQFLNGVTLAGKSPYNLSLLGVQTLGNAAPVNVKGDATLSFANLVNRQSDLVLESEGALRLHDSVLNAPHIVINGQKDIDLYADYFRKMLTVTSATGNITTELMHAEGDAALNAPKGRVSLPGFNFVVGKLVINAQRDVEGVLTAAPYVSVTSRFGHVNMDSLLTNAFTANAYSHVAAYCASLETLQKEPYSLFPKTVNPAALGFDDVDFSMLSHLGTAVTIGNVISAKGDATLLTHVDGLTRLVGYLSGTHVKLYSAGCYLTEKSCSIHSLADDPLIQEKMDMDGIDFAWLLQQNSGGMNADGFDENQDTLDYAMLSARSSDEKEQESADAAPDAVRDADAVYFDHNGNRLRNAEEYVDTVFDKALTGQPQH